MNPEIERNLLLWTLLLGLILLVGPLSLSIGVLLFCVPVALILLQCTAPWKVLQPLIGLAMLLLFAGGAATLFGAIPPEEVLVLLLRVSGAFCLTLWLRSRIEWSEFSAWLHYRRVPQAFLTLTDLIVFHGHLFRDELLRRYQAFALRQGRRPSLVGHGQILELGSLSLFDRSLRVESTRSLRFARAGQEQAELQAIPFISVAEEQMQEQEQNHRPTVLELRDVEIGPDEDHCLLKAVNLTLLPGEWTLLLGSSGAGKSTLLKTLSGLQVPLAGEILRFQKPLAQAWSQRLDWRVSMIFQNPDEQFLATTGRVDLLRTLLSRGYSYEESHLRITEIFNRLEIEELGDRLLHSLSFGEKKLMALAGVLVVKPDLLLLDEPTNGLDPRSAHRFLRALLENLPPQCALIWATHDLHLLPQKAKKVWVLSAESAQELPLCGNELPRDLLQEANIWPSQQDEGESSFFTPTQLYFPDTLEKDQ